MGFDPFNEPSISMDGILDRAYMMLKGNADRTNLQPMYERIHAEYMRASNTSNRIMYFMPFIYPDTLDGDAFGKRWDRFVQPVGFKKPPGAEYGSAFHALNDHTYCSGGDATAMKEKDPDGSKCKR